MDLLVWIIFGALVGWVASLIMKTNDEQGGVANVAIGVVGALIGGFVSRSFGGEGVTGFNLTSFVVALIGAIVLIMIVKALTRSGNGARM
jgi:uncharacterized membrane protein YeaQ/YmgE (transglycosylase-associated protein family)